MYIQSHRHCKRLSLLYTLSFTIWWASAMAYHIVPQTQGILEEAMLEGHNGYACFTIKKRPVLRTIQGTDGSLGEKELEGYTLRKAHLFSMYLV